MKPEILIIGAGMAGLATGIYAQLHGFSSKILEMHTIPGGVCTGWRRKGYLFDGCIHHLPGTQPGSKFYQLWEEVGALPRDVIYPETLVAVEDADGQRLTVYHDLERLEQTLMRIAPEDSRTIQTYVGAIQRCTDRDGLAMLSEPTPDEVLHMLVNLPWMMRWMGATMAKFGERFSNPFLRRVFPTLMYDRAATPLIVHLNLMGQCAVQQYGWPVGGSLAFAQSIAQRYLGLGGEIIYNARVEKVLVENHHSSDYAVGVQAMVRGIPEDHRANIVVSTAYGYTTMFEMLEGRYVSKAVHRTYTKPVDEIQMGIQISVGIDRDLSAEPRAMVLFLEKPVMIADREHDRLDIELFGHDPTLAPPGKGVLKVVANTSYEYWKTLHSDRPRYDAEKARMTETVIDLLAQRFPSLKEQVEVIDTATPVTSERYTGNGPTFQSTFGRFISGQLTSGMANATLPGLSNFYMAGQWVSVPSLASVTLNGRRLVRHLARKSGTRVSGQAKEYAF